MTQSEGPPRSGECAGGPGKSSCLEGIDSSAIAPKTAPTQAEISRDPRAVREAKIELLREAIHESCGFLRLHAETCQLLIEAGDDAGLIHSLGRLITYAKHAARVGNELRDLAGGPP